jgi:DNA repair exonuclease SbcCD ATPase subunit
MSERGTITCSRCNGQMPWAGTDLGGAYSCPKCDALQKVVRVCEAIVYARDRRGVAFDFDTWDKMVEYALRVGDVPPHALEDVQGEVVALQKALASVRDERDAARRDSRANSERALQLQQEREEVKAQRDEARAQFDNAFASMQAAHRNLEEVKLERDKLREHIKRLLAERGHDLVEVVSPDGKTYEGVLHHSAVHYEMGRSDERIGVDELLERAEFAISAWISVSIPKAAEGLYKLLERIQAYRKATKGIRAAGIEHGWYPKGSS